MYSREHIPKQFEGFFRDIVRDAVRDVIPAQVCSAYSPTNRIGGVALAIEVTGVAKQTMYNNVERAFRRLGQLHDRDDLGVGIHALSNCLVLTDAVLISSDPAAYVSRT